MSAAAIERALEIAARRAGIGRGEAPSSWARARVAAVLERQAGERRTSLDEAANRLASDAAAMEELVAALRVGETRFYRDRLQWEALEQIVVPALPAGEVVALSAGSSTGEEAYTLAMLLASAGRREFRVLGVDRSPEAIEIARKARYAEDATRDLPPTWKARYCKTSAPNELGEPTIAIADSLRRAVSFERVDLVRKAPRGPFHIVLFKNVLLYLASPAGEDAAKRLARELHAAGVLLCAASEVARVRAAGLDAKRLAPGLTGFGRI